LAAWIGKRIFYQGCLIDSGLYLSTFLIPSACEGIRPSTAEKDIFDLPPPELKKLIQGFVWREEHFKGATIRDIAQRENVSDSFVGKRIFQTFSSWA
jgi:hypothetical protein